MSGITRAERDRQQSFIWEPAPPPEPWLTYEQAQRYTGLSRNTLSSYVSEGVLVCYEANRGNSTQRRFRREDLDALFSQVSPSRPARVKNNGKD